MIKQRLGYLVGVFLSFWQTYSFAADIEVKLVGNQASLADIVVYLEPLNDTTLPVTNKKIVIGQQNKSFTPYISVMQLGSEVTFTNQDDITHHIYSPIGENKFDFKIRAGEKKNKADFTQLGEVAMGCNIHDWMSGYLLIINTPYFEKTNQSGLGILTDVQNGSYQLTVWHPQLKSSENKIVKTITVTKNQQFEFNVTDLLEKLPAQKSDEDFDFLDDY
mgnify:CR=1 FL=1